MATDIDQYGGCHPYSPPKKLATTKTARAEEPIRYNNKPEGDTVKEEHPIRYNSRPEGKTTNEEQPI